MDGQLDMNDVIDCEHALVTYLGVSEEKAKLVCPDVIEWFKNCVLEGETSVSKAKFLARWSIYYKMNTLKSKVNHCMEESWPLFDWDGDNFIESTEREIPPSLGVDSVPVNKMIAYWKEYLLDETSTTDLSLPPISARR